ncbi:MAG: LEA type 2 family protein [Treponema sp.]|nr:LEA type 2 family protein [Treponema sp.]
MKKTKVFIALAISASLCTCESLSVGSLMKEPVLSLNSMELTGVTFTGVDGMCTINVENPNHIDIPFPHIEWDLSIASVRLITGAIDTGMSIKARRSTIIEVPFHVDYADLYNTIASVKDASKNGAQETGFKLGVTAAFTLPVLGEKKLPFEAEGTIPLLRMVKFSDMALSIAAIDFTGVTLTCSLTVENPNAFELPVPDMEWDYAINANSFIRGRVENAAPLAAHSDSAVVLVINIQYTELYKSFHTLLAAGEADGALALTFGLTAIPAFAGDVLSLDLANTIPLLKPPSIRFTGITVKNVNIFEGLLAGNSKIDLAIGFEVENKNAFAMTLDSLAYTLTVNGSEWIDGAAPDKTVIGANRKVTIPLNVTITTLSLAREIGALVASRTTNVPYVCEGGVTIASDFPGMKPVIVPFNSTGVTRF